MEEILVRIKALADGNRLRVVFALLDRDELCVCQIASLLAIATPTVSRHMSILQAAELVSSRKDGRWVYYRLRDTLPEPLLEWLRTAQESSRTVQDDRGRLTSILSCSPAELCRKKGIST